MERIIVDGVEMKVPCIPWNVRSIGFRNAEEIRYIAQKYGKIVTPMRVDDVAEWYMGNR